MGDWSPSSVFTIRRSVAEHQANSEEAAYSVSESHTVPILEAFFKRTCFRIGAWEGEPSTGASHTPAIRWPWA